MIETALATEATTTEQDAAAALRGALAGYAVSEPVMSELRDYSRNGFTVAPRPFEPSEYPLPDEPFVAAWEAYVREAAEVGAWACLRRRLVQLQFPVAEGISRSAAYRAATRRGVARADAGGLELRDPDGLRLRLHPTVAGRIPVVVVPERSDFVALVRALTRRNEPVPVPDAMGACIVGGYNNWDRVHRLREEWRAEHPHAPETQWQARFRSIVPHKELYQDRFILLSAGCYSAVPAAVLGLDADEWIRISLLIRLEHECAHYITRRVFGSMRNSLHDELLADYLGMRAACGRFRKDWFLRFLGLEEFPRFRPGGRLEAYRGTPALSDPAFRSLQAIIVRAADQIERLDNLIGPVDPPGFAVRMLHALARESLPALAADDAAQRLHRRWMPDSDLVITDASKRT